VSVPDQGRAAGPAGDPAGAAGAEAVGAGAPGAGAPRALGRLLLAAFLGFAGIGHFVNPESFAAQVPPWFPAPEATILVSGLVEVALAVALVMAPGRLRPAVGWVLAAFFVVIFPGNISQFVTRTDAFGLDTDLARGVRLLFQPVLIVWALWCTGAWSHWRARRASQ
jgi:uncharacterized membrane protein